MSEVTTIYFIRHGQIQANIDRVWHGSTDSELTGLGIQQATALGRYLLAQQVSLDALYSSPLKRTLRTAELVGEALGLTPAPIAGLVEYGVGEFEGESFEALVERGFFLNIQKDEHFAPPGGESLAQVVARMVNSIKQLGEKHPGESIGVVSHGAAMGAALAKLIDGEMFPFNKYHMDNTSVSKALLGDTLELVYFNNNDHLSSL